jgi:hypothetical protein
VKYAVFALFTVVSVPAMAAIATISDRLRGWLLTALVFSTVLGDKGAINFVSMETYRGPDRGFEMTLTDLIALAMVAALAIRKPRDVRWLPFNSLPMLAWFLLASVSAIGTQEAVLSAFTLFKLLRGYVVYWCVYNAVRTGIPIRAVWRAALGLGLYLTGYALWQKYGLGYYRVYTIFPHPNAIPLYLNQVMPLLLAIGLVDRSPARSLASLVTALGMLFTVVTSFSRAGMAFSAIAMLAVLFLANRWAKSARATLATVVVAAGLVAGGALAAGSVIERFAEAPESSMLARDEFNRVASQMASDHPLGVGINQYSAVLTATPAYRDRIVLMAQEAQGGVCHHIYRLTLAETGWLGLAVFLLVMWRFAARTGWRSSRSRGVEGLLLASLLVGAATLHASGFLEWAFRTTPIFFLFNACAGLAMAMAEQARRSGTSPVVSPPPAPG